MGFANFDLQLQTLSYLNHLIWRLSFSQNCIVKIFCIELISYRKLSPRFLCRLTALIMLLSPFKDRAWYIRKPSNLPHRSYARHISTFRGYRFLFSIRNPYINRFTNYFSIHSKPSYPQKVVLHSITARFCLRSYYSAIWLPFSNLQTWSRDTNWMITVTHCMMGAT